MRYVPTAEDIAHRRILDKIRSVMSTILHKHKLPHIPLREPPNPQCCQTDSGFLLEIGRGVPNVLWSPWGKFDLFMSDFAWQPDHMDNLDSVLYTVKGPQTGVNGLALHAIARVDGYSGVVPAFRPRGKNYVYQPGASIAGDAATSYATVSEVERQWREIVKTAKA